MKKVTLLSLLCLLSSYTFSQCAFTVSANNPTYCAAVIGGTINVNVTGGIAPFSYQLNNGIPQASNTFNNVLAGTYTIYVTDATPCTDSVIVTSTQSPSTPININTVTPPSCAPGCDGMTTTIIIGGVPPFTYTVSGGATIDVNGTASNLCAGTTYTIVSTDANSCSSSTFLQVFTPSGPTLTVASTTSPGCVPGCNGTATTITSGGVPGYSYTVSGGAAVSPNFASNLCANTVYTMTCADANACTGTTTVQLATPNSPSIVINSSTSPTCIPGCDGTLTTITVGGTAPYIYNITGAASMDIFGNASNLCAGIVYTVMATDANGCTGTTIVTLTIPNGPVIGIPSITPPSCVPGCDATVAIPCSGGVAPYTFDLGWGAQLSNYFSGLCTGTYTVVIVDVNGCTSTSMVTINTPPLPAILSITSTNPICNGGCDGTIQVTGSGGNPPYTFTITPVAMQGPSGTFTGLCAAPYTIMIVDASGCTATVTASIADPPMMSIISVNTANILCFGMNNGLFDVVASGGVPPLTFTLYPGNLPQINNGNFANLVAGTYTVSVSDANYCSLSAIATITQAPLLTGNIINITNADCFGLCNGTAHINVNGGVQPYFYQLTPAMGFINQATGNISNLCAMTYSVIISDANGCTTTATFSISEPPPLSLSISNITNPTCNGNCNGVAQASASGGTNPVTYSIIAPGIINPATGIINGLCAGTYTVTVTDANLCSATTTFTVTQPTSLNVTNVISANPTCLGITDGTINVTLAGGIPAYTFMLNPGAINNMNGQFSNLSAGIYTITGTDANGCNTFTVVNLLAPGLNFTVNTINNLSCTCAGSISISNVTGGAAPYSYAINPVVNQAVPGTFDNMCGGVYTITVTDINNCTGTTVFNFSQIQLNTTATNSQCNGVNIGSINSTALLGAAPYTYTLNPGNVVNATGIFAGLAANTYTINVVDANTCSNSATVIIIDNTQINVSLTSIDSVICGVNGGATFFANGNAAGPYTYTVQPGNIANGIGIFNPLSAGNYTVTVNNPAGCVKSSTFDIVQVSALLPVSVTNNSYDESCYLSGDGAIDIIPANPNGLSYLWNTGAVTQDLTGITTGNYFVKVSDVNGDCTVIYDTLSTSGVNCGTVSGNVFYDVNSSCIKEIGENNINNVLMQLSNGALAYTNMQGNYQFSNVPYGTYTITQNSNPYYMPNACLQSPVTVNAINNNITNVDFKDSMSTLVDVAVYLTSNGFQPGFPGTYTINVWNNSADTAIGNLNFVINNNLTFSNTLPSNQGIYPTAGGDSIVWANINLAPFAMKVFYVFYSTPANAALGNGINSKAKIDVTNYPDNNLANNTFIALSFVMGAFDPNDKSVTPVGEGPNGHITLQDSILNYNIRFQNTGTDSAHNIYILDTLSDKLDIKTLKVTAFSHPYKVEILNGNILKFKFDNIMLPDSNINEPLSHGFIAYSINQKNTNQIADVIKNTAAIYFDFNAPIITNTTVNTIAFPTLLSSPEFDKYIKVYPNPTSDKLTLEFNSNSNAQSSITLTNTLGQMVKTVLANTLNGKNVIELNVKELPKGIYLLKLSNGKNHSMKKVVIE